MRVKRRKTMALLAAVSIVCAQSTVSDVFAAGAEEVAAQENNAVSIEYLTLQPGERDDSVNLTGMPRKVLKMRLSVWGIRQ